MKLFKITEHIPTYASGFGQPEEITFGTKEELLAITFVKSHSKQDGFYRYSLNGGSGTTRVPLLAEYNQGEKWMVIGFLDGDLSKLGLPEWKSVLL